MTNILIADDNPVDRALLQGILKNHAPPQWHVEAVASASEAVDRVQKGVDSASSKQPVQRPAILVTDLQMPGINGLELITQVKKIDPALPILLITNSDNVDIAMSALRAGATSFSPKSSLATDLVTTIKQVLEVAQRMRYTHSQSFCAVPDHQAFVLENESSLIGPTIENLQSGLPSWSHRDRLQIGMAIEEALTNAMHHGNLEVCSKLREGDSDSKYYQTIAERKQLGKFRGRKVRVEAEFSDEHICIQISDEGAGFDPASIPDPRCSENLERVSGRGLLLIRSFMDQVAHNAIGNQITMTKMRNPV